MFKLFKKNSVLNQLYNQHEKLLKEAHQLSKTNRMASDRKQAEAQAVLSKIERAEIG